MAEQARRVLVIGGGAAGVLCAATLLRRAARDAYAAVDITVVERSAVAGPGLAYGTDDPGLLLNNYVSRMSAVEDDPDHLLRWCRQRGLDVDGDTFLPRRTYGAYLAGLLDATEVPAGSSIRVRHGEVVDLAEIDGAYVATTADGDRLDGDVVVLAVGNPPPRGLPCLRRSPRTLVADPWDAALLDQVGDHDRVLLVGTGLTSVDLAARLSAQHPDVELTATSRHAMLPHRHLPTAPACSPTFDPRARSLTEVLAAVRHELDAGVEWRCVVESIKAVANEVWGGLTHEEREHFVRRLSRRWETARHRMAPAMARIIDDLLDSEQLRLVPAAVVDASAYDVVVNCTGPAPVTTPGWNPLVDNLAVKGMLWPGPLGLGADIDVDGALVDADGIAPRGIFALGAARRGVEWEVAAVPDIRRQSERLAAHLAVDARSRPLAQPA